jgi:pectate lyase
VIGNSLSLYVNGTLQLTGTDSQFASGRAGLATFFASAVFDDVVVNP